jgi:hypothetical protein
MRYQLFTDDSTTSPSPNAPGQTYSAFIRLRWSRLRCSLPWQGRSYMDFQTVIFVRRVRLNSGCDEKQTTEDVGSSDDKHKQEDESEDTDSP